MVVGVMNKKLTKSLILRIAAQPTRSWCRSKTCKSMQQDATHSNPGSNSNKSSQLSSISIKHNSPKNNKYVECHYPTTTIDPNLNVKPPWSSIKPTYLKKIQSRLLWFRVRSDLETPSTAEKRLEFKPHSKVLMLRTNPPSSGKT